MKGRHLDSQKSFLRLLKPETKENGNEEICSGQENEHTNLFTSTTSVRMNDPQEDVSHASRNMVRGVLNNSTN